MAVHIYKIGQTVRLDVHAGVKLNSVGSYKVTRLLPPLGSDFQYRIKSERETYERVVSEHRLQGAQVQNEPAPGT